MLLILYGLACLSLSVVIAVHHHGRDDLLYRVDIYLPPKEGRDESADIYDVHQTVKGLTNIEVLFGLKEQGSARIVLVLDVEKPCSWHQLTSFLSWKGYEFNVTSLYLCSDFARELGVNLYTHMWPSSYNKDELAMLKMTVPVKGLTPDEYNQVLKWMFEKADVVIKHGLPCVCFRTLAAYPVQLMYIGPVSQHNIEAAQKFVHESQHQTELIRVADLDYYTQECVDTREI